MRDNNFGPITRLANGSVAITALLGFGGVALVIVALFLVPLAGMGYVSWLVPVLPLFVAIPALVTFARVTRW